MLARRFDHAKTERILQVVTLPRGRIQRSPPFVFSTRISSPTHRDINAHHAHHFYSYVPQLCLLVLRLITATVSPPSCSLATTASLSLVGMSMRLPPQRPTTLSVHRSLGRTLLDKVSGGWCSIVGRYLRVERSMPSATVPSEGWATMLRLWGREMAIRRSSCRRVHGVMYNRRS